MLRANDLIWSFVVSNYLLGKEHIPVDLLFWNSDSTRHARGNAFVLFAQDVSAKISWQKPGGYHVWRIRRSICRKSGFPTFILATPRKDHIAPWKSTYAATRLYSGPIKFVYISDAGHMAGVISPPGTKYGHWENDKLPSSPDEWFRQRHA